MRCLLCGEEMHVVETTPDEALLVPGFEHHRLRCSSCHEEERRLVFVHQRPPLSPPIATDGSGPDFIDATLQPPGEGPFREAPGMISAIDEAPSIAAAETLPLASCGESANFPAAQASTRRHARAAEASVWTRKAALHRARWGALCGRLGLRVNVEKIDPSGKGEPARSYPLAD